MKRYNHELNFFYISFIIFPLGVIFSTFFSLIKLNFIGSKIIFLGYFIVSYYGIFILSKRKVSTKRLMFLFLVYLVYYIMYLTADESVTHILLNTNMKMIYFYYLPYCVLILSTIKDFRPLLENRSMIRFNKIIIILSFLVKFVFNNQTNYMTFSYNLLPVWILFLYHFRTKFTFSNMIVFVVMILQMLLYGARGPLIWVIFSYVAVVFLDIIYKQKRFTISKRKLIYFIIGLIISLITLYTIYQILQNIDSTNSYIVSRFRKGILGESSGRGEIIKTALHYISNMGLDVKGIYYDRLIMIDGLYSHNFVIETLISFGWVIGGSFLIYIALFILRTYRKIDVFDKKILVFITSAFFMRYFISGSMYEDQNFIIYMALVYTLFVKHRELNRKQKDLA